MMERLPRLALQAAPFWFVFWIVLAGLATPGYSHLHQAISELAAPGAPWALVVQWAGFILLGSIFLFFGLDSWKKQPARRWLWLFFLGTGLFLCTAGFFRTDEFGRRNSLSGMIHAVAGIGLILTVCITPLLAFFVIRRPFPLRIASLFTSLVLILLFVFLPNGISAPLIQFHKMALGGFFDFWYQNHGICQRLLFLVYFVWLEAFLWYAPATA